MERISFAGDWLGPDAQVSSSRLAAAFEIPAPYLNKQLQFLVKAVQAGDFDGWVQKVRGEGSPLDDPSYAGLTKPSHKVPPTTYRSVDPALFERIVEHTAAMPEKARAAGAWCPPVQEAGG